MRIHRPFVLGLAAPLVLAAAAPAEAPVQRIRPLPESEWSPELREQLGATRERVATLSGESAPQTGTLNILRTMAHHPTLMGPFLGFATALAQHGALSRRDSELLALRAIWHCRSEFEWGHHVAYARAAGITDAEIDFLTLDANRELLERSGLVDRVIGVDGRSYVRLATGFLRALVATRRNRYDLVLDFEQFIKLSTVLAFLTGAPHRIGFNTDGQGRGDLYTSRVVYRDGDHMSQVFLRLLRPLDVELSPEPLDIHIRPEETAAAERLLAESGLPGRGPVVAIHVGSGPNFYKLALKRWPPEHFGDLADRLVEAFGARVVFTGKGAEEAALVRTARARMKHDSIDACDRLTIGELLGLLRRADLTIANDTSVMHLASLVGTPVTAFFGATDPLQYGPRNPHDVVMYKDLFCSPCLTNYNLKISYCTNPVCIRSITVDETFERVGRQLAAISGFERENAS